jgi:hypothetical protein
VKANGNKRAKGRKSSCFFVANRIRVERIARRLACDQNVSAAQQNTSSSGRKNVNRKVLLVGHGLGVRGRWKKSRHYVCGVVGGQFDERQAEPIKGHSVQKGAKLDKLE